MESRYYPGVEADTIKLMTELRDLFDENFDLQTMQVSSTAILQARKSSTLRDITGLSAALTTTRNLWRIWRVAGPKQPNSSSHSSAHPFWMPQKGSPQLE